MINKIIDKEIEETKKKQELNAMLNIFYQWDPANSKIFANKTERKAASELLKMFDLQYWIDLIKEDKYFDSVYETKYFPNGLVSYKPTEMLRNYKKIKAWVNRQN